MTATADPELDEPADPADKPLSLVDDVDDVDDVELPAFVVEAVDADAVDVDEALPGMVSALT